MEELNRLIEIATQAIPEGFFLLPVVTDDGRPRVIYRERVYCYELYHQLRAIWPETRTDYCLNGEVNKRGHPYFPDGGLQPDMLVHDPGTHDNFAVIEVKPCNGRRAGIIKDFKTFERFLGFGYRHCIYIVYGLRAQVAARRILALNTGQLPLEIWVHPRPGQPALRLPAQR